MHGVAQSTTSGTQAGLPRVNASRTSDPPSRQTTANKRIGKQHQPTYAQPVTQQTGQKPVDVGSNPIHSAHPNRILDEVETTGTVCGTTPPESIPKPGSPRAWREHRRGS